MCVLFKYTNHGKLRPASELHMDIIKPVLTALLINNCLNRTQIIWPSILVEVGV